MKRTLDKLLYISGNQPTNDVRDEKTALINSAGFTLDSICKSCECWLEVLEAMSTTNNE